MKARPESNLKPKFTISNNYILLICLVTLFFIPFLGHSQMGLLKSGPDYKVWWAGSTYKIMQDQPVPTSKRKIVLRSAKNETESFQVVLSPVKNLNKVSVTISDFENKNGKIIPSKNVIIRKVEYVHVTKPSGRLHKAGWYPDPLPLCNNPFNVPADRNTPLWITVKVPDDAISGRYKADVSIQSELGQVNFPLELNVWDFTLPNVPRMRSGFNLNTRLINQYHNLDTEEELKEITDKYFQSFKAYKISPYFFYDLYPIRRTVKGIKWNGGTYDPNISFTGRYSYQINGNRSGRFDELIEIDPSHPYLLKWMVKSPSEDQVYTVTVNCYDENKQPIYHSLKWTVKHAGKYWQQDTLYIDPKEYIAYEELPDYRPFPKNAKYASVQLYACLPGGKETPGMVCFDDFHFFDLTTEENLLPSGDFEQDIDELYLTLDFTEFDKAARKYLDTLGFSGFRFKVPGLSKTSQGEFYGFVQGTPEYKKLMGLYLKGFQDHLEENEWLGKEYLYWADEPDHDHYRFVRDGMKTISEAAPKLKRFITENNPGPEIMDVTEIGCPVFCFVEPEKVKEWSKKGREYWSYLMCWPKNPHVNLFIDSYAINMRMWLWMSYKYNLEGILVWQSNQWNNSGNRVFPGNMLQNIWEDPMTYKSGYGTPLGSSPEFGNGDGMFFYPPNRDPNNDKSKYLTGPVPSIRLEILREGLDDYDYMMMLEDCVEKAGTNHQSLIKKARKLLNFGSEVFVNDTTYAKNPQILMDYRLQMGQLLEQFHHAKME